MYCVPTHHWVSTAVLYLEGVAALWFQAFKRRQRVVSWDLFTEAVVTKFAQDEYDGQMSRLLQLKQTGSVAEYKQHLPSFFLRQERRSLLLKPLSFAPCRAGEARAPPHSRDGRGHEAFAETTWWPPQNPHAMDAKIPILSALDNHFGGTVNSSNGLFTAGADRRVFFLSGLFHTNRFRPSSSASL